MIQDTKFINDNKNVKFFFVHTLSQKICIYRICVFLNLNKTDIIWTLKFSQHRYAGAYALFHCGISFCEDDIYENFKKILFYSKCKIDRMLNKKWEFVLA